MFSDHYQYYTSFDFDEKRWKSNEWGQHSDTWATASRTPTGASLIAGKSTPNQSFPHIQNLKPTWFCEGGCAFSAKNMLMQPIKGLLSIAFTCIPKRQKIVEECHGKYMFLGCLRLERGSMLKPNRRSRAAQQGSCTFDDKQHHELPLHR